MDNFIVNTLVKRALTSCSFFFLPFFVLMQTAHATDYALEAKGAAIYQELGIKYYIASLYLLDPSIEGSTVLEYAGPQQLKIKVIAKRWSARKWKAQWQNNIAINNEPSYDAELNADLAMFTAFPRGSLLKGDEILVSYQPESGSELRFNGHLVVKTQDKQFYLYVINTWLGKFSPNRIFREQISGKQSINLELVQASHQELDEDRKEKTLAWFTPKASAEALAQIAAAKLLKEKREAARQLKIQQEKDRKLLALKERDNALAAKNAQLLAAKKLADDKKKQADSKKQQAEKEKQRLAWKKKEAERLKILNQQKYYHELYQWQLSSKVNETVVYPPWARQFNHQGIVDLTLKVNRTGVISDLVVADLEVSKILIQEVEKRVGLAVEALVIPKGLKGDVWNFSIHYVFDPNNPEQEPLLKPLAPVF